MPELISVGWAGLVRLWLQDHRKEITDALGPGHQPKQARLEVEACQFGDGRQFLQPSAR